MSHAITRSTISDAWFASLERCHAAPGGRVVHLVTTVEQPGSEIAEVREVLAKALADEGAQSIDTVSETIFPASTYPDPGVTWSPGRTEDEQRLDAAAEALYSSYVDMLPLLLTADGNRRGTYFSRMVTWPGKERGGVNQLQLRVDRLRSEHRNGHRTNNTLDIDVAADATDDEPLRGVQVYAADDKRTRSFPCLTHVDLTLYAGRLHAVAVYRHQYLIDKAYGNLVGLSRLMEFLCQQSGFALGELVVHATMADDQRSSYGRKVSDLVDAAGKALASSGVSSS